MPRLRKNETAISFSFKLLRSSETYLGSEVSGAHAPASAGSREIAQNSRTSIVVDLLKGSLLARDLAGPFFWRCNHDYWTLGNQS
jgi:hypothetical protein